MVTTMPNPISGTSGRTSRAKSTWTVPWLILPKRGRLFLGDSLGHFWELKLQDQEPRQWRAVGSAIDFEDLQLAVPAYFAEQSQLYVACGRQFVALTVDKLERQGQLSEDWNVEIVAPTDKGLVVAVAGGELALLSAASLEPVLALATRARRPSRRQAGRANNEHPGYL